MCVFVCVCVRERERERERKKKFARLFLCLYVRTCVYAHVKQPFFPCIIGPFEYVNFPGIRLVFRDVNRTFVNR